MSLAPLLEAAPVVPLHAFAAMAALVLGLFQFSAPKGTLPHRTIGWIWVVLMVFVAASSFWCCRWRYGVRAPIASPTTGR
ncbi:putative membrane protein [Bradyrhizobium yuanmingense]|uniref:Membrane protein n=1 Tax=Bradyrhizobium yuanmingense TaxID=108015 RepID=A0ABV4GSH6_9BRAD